MKILRIYVDNSVFGGCFDEPWTESSNRLLDSFAPGLRVALVSELTLAELSRAPDHVRERASRIVKAAELITIDDEIRDLAWRFVEARAAATTCMADAIHVAAATCRAADLLVSWNFAHMVNWAKIRKYGAVALSEGYRLVEIRTPQEVVEQ